MRERSSRGVALLPKLRVRVWRVFSECKKVQKRCKRVRKSVKSEGIGGKECSEVQTTFFSCVSHPGDNPNRATVLSSVDWTAKLLNGFSEELPGTS